MEGPIEKGLIANETFNFDFYDNNSNISVEHFNIILSKAHKFEKKTFPCSIGIGNPSDRRRCLSGRPGWRH